MLRLLPLFISLSCAGPIEDSADVSDSDTLDWDDSYTFECDEEDLAIDPLGPADPAVGDEWTLWLRCDGTTLTGATVVQLDPPEFGSIENNVVTFLMSGTAELTMQVGSYRTSMDVTVTE